MKVHIQQKCGSLRIRKILQKQQVKFLVFMARESSMAAKSETGFVRSVLELHL